MCGIAGFIGSLSREAGTMVLDRCNVAQAHRGPDGGGSWTEPGVGLAHRRLAIIDLRTGDQPMESTDHRFVTVLNGEIYNFRALRAELAAKGCAFHTESDTEVVAAAMANWGAAEGLRRLRGMFAVAVYDRTEKTLTIARDRFGIKPLYVARTDRAVLFASEMKALLSTGLVSLAPNPAGILDFLTVGATVSPHTCWQAVEELVPGTWLRFDASHNATGGRFADLNWEAGEERSAEEHSKEVERVLLDSCERHLESDVPVGAFLSGGLDSSLLVAMLSQLRPGIDAFHVRFAEESYDESPFARRVAEHCGAKYHELFLPAYNGTLDQLSGIIDLYDQPFGDSSAIPTWLISREIARHVKVAISGDGGDEVFGGYRRYDTIRWLRALHRVPGAPAILTAASAMVGPMSPTYGRQLGKVAAMSRLDAASQLVALHTYLGASEIEGLFDRGVVRWLRSSAATEARIVPPQTLAKHHPSEQLIDFEVRSMLHGDYLRKVDIASSAHGLEVRTPILDEEVANVGLRLPLSQRMDSRHFKKALRSVATRYLPMEVVNKPKWGFGVPFDRWLRADETAAIPDYLLGASARSRDWLNQRAVRDLLHRFEHGGGRRDLSRYQVYQRVFMLIALESWLRKWNPSVTSLAA